MTCLSLGLVKPKLLIKSFFCSPILRKAELVVLRFQREYTVNVTERTLGILLPPQKKTTQKPQNQQPQKKSHKITEATWELLEWHDTSFWRLSHVKQFLLACIFLHSLCNKVLDTQLEE